MAVQTKEVLVNQFSSLQKKADDLFEQELEIKKLRSQLRKERKQILTDLNCSCDSDYCETILNNEGIGAGITKEYCHDDQDRSSLSINCLNGKIQIVTYRAVWWDYTEFSRKELSAGQTWTMEIPRQDPRYDQTNRVQVTGLEASSFNMSFRSWDD